MSHFTTVVIVKKDTKDLDAKVNKVLKRYDENRAVKGHEENCGCVGMEAKSRAWEQVGNELGTIEEVRNKFNEKYADFSGDERDKRWQEEVYLPRTAREKELTESMPDKDKANPDCKYCSGTGKYMSRYNPDSKWDWWSYGGRWNGAMIGKYKGSKDGFNFGEQYRQIENNMCLVKDIDEKFTCFAIITPDGNWHERGNMGWWGMVSNENDDWEETVKDIFKTYPDYIAILLDLHI
jgi:hypothetical protein